MVRQEKAAEAFHTVGEAGLQLEGRLIGGSGIWQLLEKEDDDVKEVEKKSAQVWKQFQLGHQGAKKGQQRAMLKSALQAPAAGSLKGKR